MLHYDLAALCCLTKLLNLYIESTGGISYSPPPSENIRYTPLKFSLTQYCMLLKGNVMKGDQPCASGSHVKAHGTKLFLSSS